MSELTRRVLFAIVAAPLALFLVWMGDAGLAALLAITAALAAWELYRIAEAGGLRPMSGLGITLAGLAPLVAHAQRLGLAQRDLLHPEMPDGTPIGGAAGVVHGVLGLFAVSPSGGAIIVLGIIALTIWVRGVDGKPLTSAAVTIFGVMYTGGMLSFGYMLRYHRFAIDDLAGTVLLGLPLLLTWGTDIGAFFVGRAFGRHKLIPSVSPKKTVEGAVGGLLAAILICWLYVRFVVHPYAQLSMTPIGIVVFAIIVSVAAQVGDLAESLLKREAGVKDSSQLIPGHGGVLDRMDSLLFVLPVAYFVLGSFLFIAPA